MEPIQEKAMREGQVENNEMVGLLLAHEADNKWLTWDLVLHLS